MSSTPYSQSWLKTATSPKNGAQAPPSSYTNQIQKTQTLDNPANYHPIALMNCILKLGTSIPTIIGTQTSESGGIFSDTTDGFRSHRNIYDRISTHITMYEDANL
jgi:hypothetical protein